MDYKRLQGESDEELINRICSEKKKIGTWDDVADILNGLLGVKYTESRYRKNYAFHSQGGIDKCFILSKKKLKEKKHSDELEDKIAELKKEKIKLQTLNLERAKLDRIEARQELYYEQIGTRINALPLPDFNPCSYENDSAEEIYVLALSDIHAGSAFKSMNNEYSIDIMKERFEFLGSRIEEFIKQHNIKILYIVGLGDFIQGCIHLNDLRINDTTVVNATVEVSRVVAQFLNYLSKFTYISYFHIIASNHSQMRYLGTKASEFMDEDMEYIIGHYIKDLLVNNERIEVIVPEEHCDYIVLPILGWNIVCMHGHQIKKIDNILSNLSDKLDTNIDYLLLGHFHNMKILSGMEKCTHDTEVLIAPSFVGSDPYSDTIFKGSKAAAVVYGFHEYEGHNETYKFILN